MAMNIESGVEWLRAPQADAAEATTNAIAPRATEGPNEASFSKELGHAIGALDELQTDADTQARQVAMGGGNLHEMAISLEKADIGMRLAMKVRNKVMDAYQEIMRMGV